MTAAQSRTAENMYWMRWCEEGTGWGEGRGGERGKEGRERGEGERRVGGEEGERERGGGERGGGREKRWGQEGIQFSFRPIDSCIPCTLITLHTYVSASTAREQNL